jgi:transcriptional regulator NrdR family protein
MQCEHCKSTKSTVTDSRASGDTIRRRRECLGCGQRFTTYELTGDGLAAFKATKNLCKLRDKLKYARFHISRVADDLLEDL